ncbi:hypothetical protein HN018_23235 (plasmid) [Lichenicola cladoniae]|uniref:Uncharacterized protein n=1 Tax=Lichenicola cladoniae TaxID=1484109 RepID=A0A6M8HY53_9PROT|nr:hypothetical protein [Lichenicola cladoniae]NPD66367.1 hypothetical protein [Acetobacteraceae bacterium]QKE93105.1 hypothetical protein HN018_23235 [Lichenicola cladoniae]
MSTKLPSISDDIRQPSKKITFDLKPREDLPDEAVTARAKEIGETWGSSTQIAPKEVPLPPAAPLVSVRFDSPDYLDKQLSIKAAELGVTKTYLILLALGKDGYRLEEVDLVKDRRRWKKR